MASRRLLIFGYGYAGRALAHRLQSHGWTVAATIRRPADRAKLDVEGVTPVPAGDRQAMAMLFARHNVRVYRYVARFTGNASLAEDIVSEVFLAVWSGAGSFKENSQVSTWLLAIARHKAIAALRRNSDEPLDDDTTTSLVADDNPDVVARLWQNVLDDAGGTMPVFGTTGVVRG